MSVGSCTPEDKALEVHPLKQEGRSTGGPLCVCVGGGGGGGGGEEKKSRGGGGGGGGGGAKKGEGGGGGERVSSGLGRGPGVLPV